jgi:hypothetical protein
VTLKFGTFGHEVNQAAAWTSRGTSSVVGDAMDSVAEPRFYRNWPMAESVYRNSSNKEHLAAAGRLTEVQFVVD